MSQQRGKYQRGWGDVWQSSNSSFGKRASPTKNASVRAPVAKPSIQDELQVKFWWEFVLKGFFAREGIFCALRMKDGSQKTCSFIGGMVQAKGKYILWLFKGKIKWNFQICCQVFWIKGLSDAKVPKLVKGCLLRSAYAIHAPGFRWATWKNLTKMCRKKSWIFFWKLISETENYTCPGVQVNQFEPAGFKLSGTSRMYYRKNIVGFVVFLFRTLTGHLHDNPELLVALQVIHIWPFSQYLLTL